MSKAALPIALQLVGDRGELILVRAAAPPDHVECDEYGRPLAYLDQQEESVKREVLSYLRDVVAELQHSNPGLRVIMDVRIGDPAPGIVMAELDRRADLVVMTTHGRTGLRRAIVGSVAGKVLRTGRAPVVLVGPVTAVAVTHTAQIARAKG